MKIGIDGVALSRPKTGVGFYVYYHLHNLIRLRERDHFFIYSPRNSPDLEEFSQLKNVTVCINSFLSQSDSVWSQTTLAYLCYRDKIEAFWGCCQSFPLLSLHSYKKILTIYDFTYRLYPETVSTFKCILMRLLQKRLLDRASHITVISKGTGTLLSKFYNHSQWHVIYPPLKKKLALSKNEMHAFLDKKNLEFNGYIVTISSLEPRKNLLLILEHFERVLKTTEEKQIVPLVLIGGGGWKNKKLLERIQRLKRDYPHLFFPMGYCSEEEISKLLEGAAYLVMLSKYEGYGMPLAEARQCNTHVVCSDLPEMREAAENDAMFIDLQNTVLLERFFLKENVLEKRQALCHYPKNEEIAQQLSNLFK